MNEEVERKCRNLMKLDVVNESLIKSYLNNELVNISETRQGQFDGFDVQFNNEKYLFPNSRISKKYNKTGTTLKLQKKASLFIIPLPLSNFKVPAIGRGAFRELLKGFASSDDGMFQANEWLVSLFEEEDAARFYTQQVCRSTFLTDYKEIILEAIIAYFSGYKSIPTMSLFPVFEGALRELQIQFAEGEEGNVSKDKFIKQFKKLSEKRIKKVTTHYTKTPLDFLSDGCEKMMFASLFDIHCDVIAAIKEFFEEVLYKKSTDCDQGFNRHLVMHMLKNDFNEKANFVRMIIVISYIVYLEDVENNITPFDDISFDRRLNQELCEMFKKASKSKINLDEF
ncbi:TPA: hypothetical protein RSW70_000033 [Vibrio cholerae]|uniref:hypothetical protein n=1 Tax=Vibrio cholerae TaxID=666 RepID=UPI0002C17A5F|nr:hypothetical protein [Vibrio cholerae]EGR2534033.1 hypothetical protein [Vibrio cholerae]EGR2571259.1 hypothetical protein [Vibrio cholerae]EGR4163158.1 hypothetical protein [Vibrio cholerae]EGR4170474.1 hypothetical protein [Vibrio cholerae]EII3000772.1 hypothetical protein [Vibrio cholerae]